MPPILALLACYGFIFWAFRRDAREHPYLSSSLWLPTLWMMRCGSRSIDYWFGGGEETAKYDQILLLLLVLGSLVALSRRPANWGGVIGHNAAVFLFYGYIFLSISWVQGFDNPLTKLLRPVGDLCMALVVATEPNPRQAIITMCRRTCIALIPLSIVLIKYYPYLGRMQDKHWGLDSWIGVCTHKNPLGQLCLAASLGVIWTMIEDRRRGIPLKKQRFSWILALLISYPYFAGDVNSRSSTAIFCLFLCVALLWAIGRLRNQIDAVLRKIMGGAVVLLLLSGMLNLVGSSPQDAVAAIFGKDATLSDRTYLWADVIRIGSQQHLMLGSGYGSFWVPSLYPQLSPMVDNKPAEAHNGYLETFANLGLVGVFLLAIMIVQSIRSAAVTTRTDFEYGRMRLAVLIMVVVLNYSEAAFPRGCHLWWFSFLVFALYARPWVAWPEEPAAPEAAVSVGSVQVEVMG